MATNNSAERPRSHLLYSGLTRRSLLRSGRILVPLTMLDPFALLAVCRSEASGTTVPQISKPAPKITQSKGAHILVFDVIETMLNVNSLEPHFERAFGNGSALREWFSTMLHYSVVVTLADAYSDFGSIAKASLQIVAKSRNTTISSEEQTAILQGVRTLPAHPEVADALKHLHGAGFRLFALTNSALATAKAQLEHANLSQHFEGVFSADAVHKFKPAPEVYRFVTTKLGTRPEEMRLIAAHGWDVLGALKVGWSAAFVARPGKVLFPMGPQPDITGADLKVVAEDISPGR
jgi:2-haloacid dehalogenase